jgi:hypothetical protein
MSKTPITWLELINQKIADRKKEGKSASIRDVVPEAKTEWTKIKAGTHADYTQGKAKTHKRKKEMACKTSKTYKNSKNEDTCNEEVKKLLSNLKLCGKCSKQLNKAMNKQKGGNCNLYQLNGPQPLVNEGPIPQSGILNTEPSPSVASSSLNNAEPVNAGAQKGGNCGCNLTGGKKSKHKHSKKCKQNK